MPKQLTKTFTDTRYWRRQDGPDPIRWTEIPRAQTGEIALDAQVKEWVERTGATIVHPGQVGIHSQWLDPEMRLRCTIVGLVVLYVEDELTHGKQEPQRGTAESGPNDGPDPGRANEAGYAFEASEFASAVPAADE